MLNKVVVTYLLAAFFAWFAPSVFAVDTFSRATGPEQHRRSDSRICTGFSTGNYNWGTITGQHIDTGTVNSETACPGYIHTKTESLCSDGHATHPNGGYGCNDDEVRYYVPVGSCPVNSVSSGINCVANSGYTGVKDSNGNWSVQPSKNGTCSAWTSYNDVTNSCDAMQCPEGTYYSGTLQQCTARDPIADCEIGQELAITVPASGEIPATQSAYGCGWQLDASIPEANQRGCVTTTDGTTCTAWYTNTGNASQPNSCEANPGTCSEPYPGSNPTTSGGGGGGDTGGGDTGGGDTGGGDTGGGDTGGGDTGGGDTGGGDTGGGDTGGGDTGGGEDGTGDCEEYDCATESTLKRIADGLEGDYDATVVDSEIAAFDGEIQAHEESLAQSAESMWFSFFESGPISSLYDGYEELNPLTRFSGSNCSFSVNVGGVDRVFSYCDEQDTIHTILGFCLFCFLILSVRELIFERPGGAA